jgi:ATP-dependent helicase/nuclease subunit B
MGRRQEVACLSAPPRVFNIANGIPFVDALAAGLTERAEGNPLQLAAITILLPTRRACRALREAFLRGSAGQALLLPRMIPLGDLDAEELVLGGEVPGDDGLASTLELPPAFSGLRRQLILTRLVAAGGRDLSWDQAAALARSLGQLLDRVETERADFKHLADLVPENYAGHWQITLDFLKVLIEVWPAIRADEGVVDAATRRNLVIEGQARRWQAVPPSAPVFAAGSTGSIPATAELLSVLCRLPNCGVILPGLDQALAEDSFDAIGPCHPQYGLKRLLLKLDVTRQQVEDWSCPGVVRPAVERTLLLSAALDPNAVPVTTELAPGFAGLTRLDCQDPQQEAMAIALLMRETLERPGATAALVTPDRALARRVAAELGRYDVDIDDSAGQPLTATPPGSFLRLILAAIEDEFAPASLLSLLKHPLCAGGATRIEFLKTARQLEEVVLRGPRPGAGLAGIMAALPDRPGPLRIWVSRLQTTMSPMIDAMAERQISLVALANAHVAVAEALAATDIQNGSAILWAGDAGEQAAGFLNEFLEASEGFPPVSGRDYPALFDQLILGRVVRPSFGRHPRLAIWGPLEARLKSADRIILGGLNEGSWPADPPTDPWLRIGMAAHDFVQACGAAEVFLTRSQRVDGTPTVPSRWLRHLERVRALALPDSDADTPWIAWVEELDRPQDIRACDIPMPRPPVAERPRELPVTQIEQWMRDPYGLYARRILKLRPLDPLDADPGAAERGMFIHEALDMFVRHYPDAMPEGALPALLEMGRQAFGPALAHPGVWAFWWPRFEAIARWFVGEEGRRRADLSKIATECKGRIVLDFPSGPFILTAKADRIEIGVDGALGIIDYKTGSVPSNRDIEAGRAPQLPLEGLIGQSGGFEGVPAALVRRLEFWHLRGGSPAGTIDPVKSGDQAIDKALDGLRRLVETFDDPRTAYTPVPRAEHQPRYNDYAHLARLKEWMNPEDGDDRT